MKYNDNGTYKDIYVKAFDTLPVGAEVDYDGSVVPDGWTEVEDPNTYSTDEIRVGTWIDGKPIYRKVVRNIIPTGVGISVYNDNNIESVIHYYGLYNQNDIKYVKQINFWFSNTDYMTLNYSKNNKSFILDNTSNYNNNGTVDLIIEYTKTTD